jgi:ubiquinone/menaquinone biosynthesis C-methylase UbiE
MLRRASRALQHGSGNANLIRADLRCLPFPAGSFDTAILTFPTAIIRDPTLWRELARVVRQNGRIVVVVSARSPSQKIEVGGVIEKIPSSQFSSEHVDVEVQGSLVSVIVATVKAGSEAQPKSELTDSSQ